MWRDCNTSMFISLGAIWVITQSHKSSIIIPISTTNLTKIAVYIKRLAHIHIYFLKMQHDLTACYHIHLSHHLGVIYNKILNSSTLESRWHQWSINTLFLLPLFWSISHVHKIFKSLAHHFGQICMFY